MTRLTTPEEPAALDRPVSRRALLKKGGAGVVGLAVAPGLLAACGSGGSSSSSNGGTSSGSAAPKVGGKLDYLGYEGEDYPKILKQFERANGITVKSSYIGNTDDIAPKFAAGGGKGIDVVDYGSFAITRLQQSGVKFQPIDKERIANWKNVEKFIGYTGDSSYVNEKGEIVGVPIYWGALGITYDSSAIDKPTSWEELRGPAFKGKLTMIDSATTNYDLAAAILGKRSNQMTKDDLAEVNDYLKGILANCRKLSNSFGDITNLFVSGEIQAVFAGWAAVNVFAAGAGKKTIKTNLTPKEGSAAFVELWSIPEGSDNADTAYALINELLDPKINAAAADATVGSATADGAIALQAKPVASLYPAESDLEAYFKKSVVYINAPLQSDEFVTFGDLTEAWQKLKSEVL